MTKWITWELFEDRYGIPARAFPGRCNYKTCMIYVGGKP